MIAQPTTVPTPRVGPNTGPAINVKGATGNPTSGSAPIATKNVNGPASRTALIAWSMYRATPTCGRIAITNAATNATPTTAIAATLNCRFRRAGAGSRGRKSKFDIRGGALRCG